MADGLSYNDLEKMYEAVNVGAIPPTETALIFAALVGAFVAVILRTILPFYIRVLQGKLTWGDFHPDYIGTGVFAAVIGALAALTQAPEGVGGFMVCLISFAGTFASNHLLNEKPG